MKKPDRFERLVVSITKSDEDVGYDKFCFPDDVANALRKEHRWVERMIGKQQRYMLEDGVMVPDKDGAWVVVNLLQDQLKKRRK